MTPEYQYFSFWKDDEIKERLLSVLCQESHLQDNPYHLPAIQEFAILLGRLIPEKFLRFSLVSEDLLPCLI